MTDPAFLFDATDAGSAAQRLRARRRLFAWTAAVVIAIAAAVLSTGARQIDRREAATLAARAEAARERFADEAAAARQALEHGALFAARGPEMGELVRQAAIVATLSQVHDPDGLVAQYRAALRDRLAALDGAGGAPVGFDRAEIRLEPSGAVLLRTHAPGRHGDFGGLDAIANAAGREGRVASGFQAGPLFSGLRAAAPVFGLGPDGAERVVGVLSTGASFGAFAERVAAETGRAYGLAVRMTTIRAADPNAARELARAGPAATFGGCDCALFGGSALLERLALHAAATIPAFDRRAHGFATHALLSRDGERTYAVFAWPVDSRLEAAAGGAETIGWVIAAEEVTAAVAATRRETALWLGGGALAVLATLAAIWFAIRGVAGIWDDALAKATAALRARTAEAQAAVAAKSRFVATLSHEIRTPLNGLLGTAELLARSPLDVEQTRMVETMRRSGGFLLATLNDVLDAAKIEAGGVSLEAAPFDVAAVLGEVRDLHGPGAEAKGLAMTVETRGDRVWRRGDAHRVAQILHNLVGNAVKFTERGGVALTLDATAPGAIALTVRDDGPGMDRETARRVFNPYEQADAGVARRHGGTGLGLSIVRGLVDAMGGDIEIDTAPGQGAAITARLPLPVAAPAAPAAAHPAAGAPRRGLRVLAADDNDVNRTVLAGLLKTLGAEPTLASDGAEAVAAFAADPDGFDLVLLDSQMPRLDGAGALAAIRAREAGAGRTPIPVVACTASTLPEDLAAFAAAGFDGHLAKPLSLDTLSAALARAAPVGAGAAESAA